MTAVGGKKEWEEDRDPEAREQVKTGRRGFRAESRMMKRWQRRHVRTYVKKKKLASGKDPSETSDVFIVSGFSANKMQVSRK